MIDPQTVYLRMPATFMESEACLLTLRNLMMKAYDKEPKDAKMIDANTEPKALEVMQAAAAST